MNYVSRKSASDVKTLLQKRRFKNASKAVFLPKIAFRKFLLSGWVETFVACYWCRWKVQDMTVRVVFFILKLVRKFLSDGELNTAWNREKIAMSQGFARYWVTLLYGSTAHCSGYGIAMGCYGLFIVTRTAIVTSQWYGRYCFTEYARTWERHPTTPWQRECTAITDRQSIDSLLDSMRFILHFWEITPYILRGVIVVFVQYQCYSINARAFSPRTPYRVGGLAGDVMRAWASHSLVNHWIYTFEASLLSRLLYICTG